MSISHNLITSVIDSGPLKEEFSLSRNLCLNSKPLNKMFSSCCDYWVCLSFPNLQPLALMLVSTEMMGLEYVGYQLDKQKC